MEGEEAKNIQTSKDPREQVSLSRSRILALLVQMCVAWARLQSYKSQNHGKYGGRDPALLLPSSGKILAPTHAHPVYSSTGETQKDSGGIGIDMA
jgi:hypothetical protein